MVKANEMEQKITQAMMLEDRGKLLELQQAYQLGCNDPLTTDP